MISVIVFCGAPGSGKTTLSKVMTRRYDAERISFDERNFLQHIEMIPTIVTALGNGKSVVADSVFTTVSQRKLVLDAVKNIPCKKIAVFMNTPLVECIRRNAERPNPLPKFMVESIYHSIEEPNLSEGWDEIIVI